MIGFKMVKFKNGCLFIFLWLTVILATCSGVIDTCSHRKWEREGDVTVHVIAGLHEGGQCQNVSRENIPLVLAMEWAIGLLNGDSPGSEGFIPNVSIGFEVYDNCDSVDMTTDILYTGRTARQNENCDGTDADLPLYIGTLAITSPESASIVSRLRPNLPVVRPLPPKPWGPASETPILHTTVSFNQEAKAMLNLLSTNSWNFVAIVHTDDDFGNHAAQEFSRLGRPKEICIIFTETNSSAAIKKIHEEFASDRSFNTSLAVLYFGHVNGALELIRLEKSIIRPYGSKITWVFTSAVSRDKLIKDAIRDADTYISIAYPEVDVRSLTRYLEDVANSTKPSKFTDIVKEYKSKYGSSYRVDFVPQLVDAILSIVSAAKDRINSSCLGTNVLGTCDQFRTSRCGDLSALVRRGLTLPAGYIGAGIPMGTNGNRLIQYTDAGMRSEAVLEAAMTHKSMNSFSKIGTFDTKGDYTVVVKPSLLPTSACKTVCSACQHVLDMRFSYFHGDVIILGLFSLRMYGSAFECGNYRRGIYDAITVSSFMEYIKYKNQNSETGITYGGLAIDDCYQALNTTSYLVDLFSKRRKLQDPETGRYIDFSKVIAIVGALSSPVSIVVADMATELEIPMISYSASSPELDNKNRYPFFMRTVPSDTLQVRGIVQLIQKLNVTLVGAVFIDDTYGNGARSQIYEEAAKLHICVEEPVMVTQDASDDYLEKNVVDRLYGQQVRMVIYFGLDSIAKRLLQIMSKDIYNKGEHQPLIFVASEAWGTSVHLISDNLWKRSIGTLVFNIATRQIDTEVMDMFETFLSTLKSNQTQNNKWIPRFFEDQDQCNFIGSFDKYPSYSKICKENDVMTLSPEVVQILRKEQRSVHTMIAVHAVVAGFQDLCQKQGLATDCRATLTKKQPLQMVNSIRQVKVGQSLIFDDDLNGNIGYVIYNIQLKDGAATYEQVGTYSNSGQLQLSEPKFYNDVQATVPLSEIQELKCTFFTDKCPNVCLQPTTSSTTTSAAPIISTTSGSKTDSTMLVTTVVFGVVMVFLAVALIVVICLLLRRQTELYDMSKRASMFDNNHAMNINQDPDEIYHTPNDSTRLARRRHHDNPSISVDSPGRTRSKTSGSMTSLDDQSPVQYSYISQTSLNVPSFGQRLTSSHENLPRKQGSPKHGRQRSNYELKSQPSPGLCKASIQTPTSAPTPYSKEEHGARQKYSPRFRFSPDPTSPMPDRDSVFGDTIPSNTNDHQFSPGMEGYLAPNHNGATNPEDDNTKYSSGKITYLTAKDLVNNSSDEEEDEVIEEKGVPFRKQQFSSAPNGPQGLINHGFDPELISPLNDEIVEINFPSSNPDCATKHKNHVRYTKQNGNSDVKPKRFTSDTIMNELEDDLIESPVDEGVIVDEKGRNEPKSSEIDNFGTRPKPNTQVPVAKANAHAYKPEGAIWNPVSGNRTSLSEVPDIIRHGAYDDENVFII